MEAEHSPGGCLGRIARVISPELAEKHDFHRKNKQLKLGIRNPRAPTDRIARVTKTITNVQLQSDKNAGFSP